MHTNSVLPTQRNHVRNRIYHSQSGGSRRQDDRSNLLGPQYIFKCIQIHPAVWISRNRLYRYAQHIPHPGMRIMRFPADRNPLVRMLLPTYKEPLQIGNRSTAGQMPQCRFWKLKHPGQFSHNLFFHCRRWRPPIQCMVVRIDTHGRQIPQNCDRMRRLEHLSRIAGMKERIIPRKPVYVGFIRGAQRLMIYTERRMQFIGPPA